MNETAEKILKLEEVLDRLPLSRADVYRRVKDGQLQAVKVDHRLQFNEADVEKFRADYEKGQSSFRDAVDQWLNFYQDRLRKRGDVELPNIEGKNEDERLGELVRRMVLDGILNSVNDIHIDPLQSGDRLLYRLEGTLEEIGRIEADLSGVLKAKLKGLAPLTDSDGRSVLDGIFSFSYNNLGYQIHLKIAPTLLGEHIHLHFYPQQAELSLLGLGYTSSQADILKDLLTGRPGLFLVIGAFDPLAERHRLGLANELAGTGRLVVSLDHRTHHRSELLVQLEISSGDDSGFDALVGTALGMSPDVLMLDEVREAAEAHTLLEAVYSGAVAIAQMRSPGSVEALLTLIGYGLSRDGLAQTLLGTVERIAFRRLCPHCRVSRPSTVEEAELLGISNSAEIWESQGCLTCRGGFLGHRMIYGVWAVDEDLAGLIRSLEPPGVLLNRWCEKNPFSAEVAVREAVLAGDVTFKDARILLTRLAPKQ